MRSPFRKLVFAALSLVLVGAPFLSVDPAWAASPALEEAQKLYDDAKFGDAIAKLRDALSSGQVTGSEVVSARALMARCLVKNGNRIEAKQAFKTVLRSDPGFKLDTVVVPPDEIEVFNLATKEIQAEQIEAGQRIPASLAFYFGVGSGDNKHFAELVKEGGGDDKFDSKSEFGGSVRFPIHPRWSLDIELTRFRATNRDSFVVNPRYSYEATAIPLALSVYWTAMTGSKHRVNLFIGGGPMMASRPAIKFNFPGAGYFVADEKVGTYFHGGVEGEYLVMPKLAVTGRVLGRSASATKLYKDSEIGALYSGGTATLKNQKVDFSGFGVFLGLRGYIGY